MKRSLNEAMKRMPRTGWIRAVIRAAEDAAEELNLLDRDGHSAEESRECHWCEVRRRAARSAKMARRQLDALEQAEMRRQMGLKPKPKARGADAQKSADARREE